MLHEISIFPTVMTNVADLSMGISNVSRLQLNKHNEDLPSLLQNKQPVTSLLVVSKDAAIKGQANGVFTRPMASLTRIS